MPLGGIGSRRRPVMARYIVRLLAGPRASCYGQRMSLELTTLPALAGEYAARTPQDILSLAFAEYAPAIGISFSGAEDVVLIDMAVKLGAPFTVFSLDTGRLHPETYQFIEKVRTHYGITIETVLPQADAVQQLVKTKGLFSFYQDGHTECCGIRKVEPLTRALAPLSAWITGQRKDQSPGTRAEVPVVQLDRTFGSAAHEIEACRSFDQNQHTADLFHTLDRCSQADQPSRVWINQTRQSGHHDGSTSEMAHANLPGLRSNAVNGSALE